MLLHVLDAWESVDDTTLDRCEALAFEFYRAGDWQLDTAAEHYLLSNQLANVDAIVARRGRTPRVVGDLLDSAIADNDAATIDVLFAAIDSVAFYHGDGALALTMLERAYISAARQSKTGSSRAWPASGCKISHWWTRFCSSASALRVSGPRM